MLALDLEWSHHAGLVGDQFVPVGIATRGHRAVGPEAPPDDDVVHRRGSGERVVCGCLHGHVGSAPQRTVARDEHFRARIRKPGADSGRREPREDRHLNRPDVRTRVRCDRDLGRHRQEDADRVARFDAQCDERLCQARRLERQLRPRQRAPATVFRSPDGRLCVGPLRRPPMHARVGDIECPTEEPGRPLDPVRGVDGRRPVRSFLGASLREFLGELDSFRSCLCVQRSARTARQNRSGSSIESAWSDAKSSQPRLRASRATFAVSRCRAVGVQVNGSPVIG